MRVLGVFFCETHVRLAQIFPGPPYWAWPTATPVAFGHNATVGFYGWIRPWHVTGQYEREHRGYKKLNTEYWSTEINESREKRRTVRCPKCSNTREQFRKCFKY